MQKPLRLSCDAERQADGFSALYSRYIYVTGPGKTGLMCTSTVFHFLFVRERYTHALSRNTKYLTIDDQVCFHRQLFTDAVKPRGCISRLWGGLIGLHGVPSCSWRQSWPPLWIVPVLVPYWGHSIAAWVQMVALARLRLPTFPHLPPFHLPTPYRLNLWYYRQWKNLAKKPAAFK